ncbi:uncharacterized protein [Halyomorpha halys]|uniref:uncharacterized protein isoform X3 n=1 Tax=Halyomorpha halys TaxID=286706 RepID=UPI0034D2121B
MSFTLLATTSMNSSSDFTEEEKTDETEPTCINNLSIFIKEKKADETEYDNTSNSSISINEVELDSQIILIKEEEQQMDCDGFIFMNQEAELLVPDHIPTIHFEQEDGEQIYYGMVFWFLPKNQKNQARGLLIVLILIFKQKQ